MTNPEFGLFLKEFRERGYFVIKKFLTEKKLKLYKQEIKNVVNKIGSQATPPIGEQARIAQDEIVNNIHFHSDEFFNLATDGKHIDLLSHILNDPYYGLIPNEKPNFLLAQCNLRKVTPRYLSMWIPG